MGHATSLALIAALALAACGSTQQATEAARSSWVGKPADSFFAKNGPPIRQFTMSGGDKVYSWQTLSMPSGTRTQLVCTADIVVDARGAIQEIRLKEDSIGHWNTSRCSEIFG